MADMIQCPNCGANNPADQKVCQKCQTPLTDVSFKAGQMPVRKDTGELEPILPQWLKDARESARDSADRAKSDAAASEPPAQQSTSPTDFLAGLQSQSKNDEEEEVPDWLANITGAPSKPKTEHADSNTTRRVEMGKKDDFPQEDASAESDAPPWLAGLQGPKPGEKDELTSWFQNSSESEPPQTPDFESSHNSELSAAPFADETPDWLRQMAKDAEASTPAPQETPSETPFAEIPISPQTQTLPPAELSFETPDWLSSLNGKEGEETSGEEVAPFAESGSAESEAFPSSGELPSWLNRDENNKSDSTPIWLKEPSNDQVSEGVPAWLSTNEETVHMPAKQEDEPPSSNEEFGGIPDWLKAAAPETSIFDAPTDAEPNNTLDWISASKPAESTEAKPPVPETSAPAENISAFDFGSTTENTGDALFAEMPDWLSNPAETASSLAPTIVGSDLAPSDLPSWVEAMRPVGPVEEESSLPEPVSFVANQPLESRGALAGLHGVLPTGTGFMPTSKPKAYSIKLNATEEQLQHAEILEQILAAETAPVAIGAEASLHTSRALRWTLAFFVLAITIIPILLHTQIFATPLTPNEVQYAEAIVQAIPESAPMLVAFDYDPSRTAEMEAAAAPMLDYLLLLKHPRLTFISSNESGSMLAERLMTGPLAGHHYQSGVTYVNLGYLSGGTLGIRGFAQNPSAVAPLDISLQPAWALPPLQNVAKLDHFAAIILISDNADSARAWVEQTEGLRGSIPLLIVSSAQAVPLLRPYYDSGQVAGIVPGLYGGTMFEQFSGGRPGTARSYWDAYSLGMVFASIVVVLGGLISMFLGLRDRSTQREAK